MVDSQPMVTATLDRGLLMILLNNPERRNALNPAMAIELLDVVEAASTNGDVRAVLLRGAGGYFCVGGDVKAMDGRALLSFEAKLAHMQRTTRAVQLLHEMPKPTVVAIEGAVAGAGLGLALACDISLIGQAAKMTTAFAAVGTSGDYGVTYFLDRLVGPMRASELLFLPRTLSGAEAQALGLVTMALPDASMAEEAEAVARRLADGPTIAFGHMKRNLKGAASLTLADYLPLEAAHHCLCAQTEDFREAVTAFAAKRAPTFLGR